MGYQVLARKWRPKNFAELVGQEHVVTAISNALDNNRLHHAYLFTGTRGVGKTTIARIFSKSLNCDLGMSSSPCGKCATCKEIEQGNFVDLLEIDAASRTKVEDTRELLDNVQYKPTRGDYKVYLIDEVHMLSKHSFNALLKTLEEPPPHVKFLLATTDPQKLPITILSRCLQFNLKALSRSQISQQLSYILEQENIASDDAAVAQLARAAQGSMRDALSLTDQAIAQGNGQVSSAIVTDMLGLMDKGQILKLVHAVLTQKSEEVMHQVEQLSFQGPDYGQILAEIMSLLHQVALTQFVPEACKLETISARAIYQLAKTVPAEQVQLLYQIALQGKKDIPYAADGRSGLEMTLLRMLAFNPAPIHLSIEDFNIGAQGASTTLLPVQNADTPSLSHKDHQISDTDGQAITANHDSVKIEQGITHPQSQAISNQNSHSEVPLSQQSDGLGIEEDAPEKHLTQSPKHQVSGQFTASETYDNEPSTSLTSDLVEQQEQILEQADSLHPSHAAANEFNMSMFEELPPSEQMQNIDYSDNDMAPPVEHPTEPNLTSHQPSFAPEPQDNNTSIKTTESLLALKRKLSESAKQQKEQDPSVKKSESSSEDSISRILSRKRPDKPADEEAPEALSSTDTDRDSHQIAENPGEGDSPPWQQEQPSTPQVSHAQQSNSVESSRVNTPQVQGDASQLASAGLENHVEEFDPNAHLDEKIEVEVDFDVPAFLESGEKVVAATQLDTWSQLINQMPVTALTKQLALHSAYSKQGDTVTLTLLESKPHLNSESAKQQLQQALSEALQQPVNLVVQLAKPVNTPYAVQQTINQVRQQYAQEVVNTDQTIVQLRDTFNATIVEQSIKPR